MAGITPDGQLVIMRLEEIRQAQADDVRELLGDDVRLGADSVLGQVLDASAVQLAAAWEALGELATALDPDQAVGEILDGLVALSGVTPRQGALPSVGSVTLSGTNGTVIPAGARIRGASSRVVVETVQQVTLTPSGGAPSATVGVRALEVGPLEVPAGDLSEIVTPYAGWASVTNPAALVPGRLIESDFALRVRRELGPEGSGTEGGIRGALLEVPEVQQAAVLSNRAFATLPSGQPGKSARAVLWPDTGDPEVEEQIARVLAGPRGVVAGIRAWGTSVVADVTLNTGQATQVAWDYAEPVPIYVAIDLTVTALVPDNIIAAVGDAVEAWLNTRAIGEPVSASRIACVAVNVSPEIVDATVRVGVAPSPTGTIVPIDDDQIARVGDVAPVIV